MAAPGPLTNQRLGDKYLLGDLLGQGGFGAVYTARHLLLNRQQAIKILLEQHFTSPKFRERFTREAQTLAALDQPNIVHVDDFGFDGNRAFLVMPYIGGGTLQQILRTGGALPPDQVLRYLEQIAAALDYAHARNVAHLDLKPLNLLVHEDGRLLLSDFGLAHLMEQGAIEGSTSLQFGTPTYMAPEHLQGQPERRSDIYALGIMVYQMLTGRVPFEGSNAAAIMLKHMTEPPPKLGSVRPDLPSALEGVINKALAKRTAARYETAGALLQDFRAVVVSQSSGPLRSSPPLEPTMRATYPPVDNLAATINPSGVMFGSPSQQAPTQYSGGIPSGGLVPTPLHAPAPVAVAAPPQPKPASIWTPGFTALFAVAAVAGGIMIYFWLSPALYNDPSFGQFFLLGLGGALTSTCLVGLRYTSSRLIRAGLLLQALSAILAILVSYMGRYSDFSILVVVLPASVSGSLSLFCISYGTMQWKGSSDAVLMTVQAILSIAITFYYHPYFLGHVYDLLVVFTPLVLQAFATLALILRPVRRKPAATFLLVLGGFLSWVGLDGFFGGP